MLLKQGDVVGKRYRITGKLLGEGGSSEVRLPLVVPLRLKRVSSRTSLFPLHHRCSLPKTSRRRTRRLDASQCPVCATIDSVLTPRGTGPQVAVKIAKEHNSSVLSSERSVR